MRDKHKGKKENSEGMPIRNWELSFTFKTTAKNTGLFGIDNPTLGGYDRDFYLKNG